MKLLISLHKNKYLENLSEVSSFIGKTLIYDILMSSAMSGHWVEYMIKTSGLLWLYDPYDEKFLPYDAPHEVDEYFSDKKIKENISGIMKCLEAQQSIEKYDDFLSLPLQERGAIIKEKSFAYLEAQHWGESEEVDTECLVWQDNQLHILIRDKLLMPFVSYVALHQSLLNLQEYTPFMTLKDMKSLYMVQKNQKIKYPEFLEEKLLSLIEHEILDKSIENKALSHKKNKI